MSVHIYTYIYIHIIYTHTHTVHTFVPSELDTSLLQIQGLARNVVAEFPANLACFAVAGLQQIASRTHLNAMNCKRANLYCAAPKSTELMADPR